VTSDLDAQLARIPDPFAHGANQALPPAPARPAASLTRSRRQALRVACVCAAVLYEGVGLLVCKARPDIATMPAGSLALGVAVPLGAGALAFAAVFRRGTLGLGEPAARLAAWVVGAPVLFAIVTLAVWPSDAGSAEFWPQAKACFVSTAILAAGPLVLGTLALMRAFAAASGWRTAALGVASGALAAATMAIACPNGGAFHLLVGHGAAMVVMGLAAAWMGRRLLTA
jgi:hypothetical protein